jgi:hypothetical protein
VLTSRSLQGKTYYIIPYTTYEADVQRSTGLVVPLQQEEEEEDERERERDGERAREKREIEGEIDRERVCPHSYDHRYNS